MKKWKLIGNIILSSLVPLIQLGTCIFIWILSPASWMMNILYMGGAYIGISILDYGIETVYTIMKQKLKRQNKTIASKNIEKNQKEPNQNHVHEVTYARTLENNSLVEAETCVEYSNQQINAILERFEVDSTNQQISKYELEKARLYYQILTYRQAQNMLKDRIATTTNKEELRILKQKLTKKQFMLQDLVAQSQKYEEASETEYKSTNKKV